MLDVIRDIVTAPIQTLRHWKYPLFTALVSKRHILVTGASCWESPDMDFRVLHGLFNALVTYVEVDQAWAMVIHSPEDRIKYKLPWWRKHWLTTWSEWRCPAAGVAHLEWLGKQDDFPFPAAVEALELYTWWKVIRPSRPDSHEISGWNEAVQPRGEFTGFGSFRDPEYRAMILPVMKRLQHIEAAYAKEDEEMLIRLIKIRQHI